MPELPEVETLRRQLEAAVCGRSITAVVLAGTRPSPVASPVEEEFVRALVGRRIEALGRRGKYLDFRLEHGLHWVVHLRMTGVLLLRPPGSPPDPYVRFAVTLDDDRELRFADVRKFGLTWVAARLEDVLPPLGPEPWDPEFSAGYLAGKLAGRRAPIKSAILDQRLVAGVGNIYADEALFHAGVHPLRTGAGLDEAEFGRLRDGIVRALEHGLGLRGASFSDFVDAYGEKGGLQAESCVALRGGEPCRACGTPVEKIKVGGRGTYFCPTCQPRAGRRRSRGRRRAAHAPRSRAGVT